MSNDLINSKLVYADDICRYIKTEINPYGKPFQGSAYELGLKIMEHIEKISAAYDVDKVVEQICGCDGCSGCCNCHEEEKMLECEEYARIYGIVKAGIVNE